MVRPRVKLNFSRTRQDASLPTTTRPTRDGNRSRDRAISVNAEAISLANPLPQRSRLERVDDFELRRTFDSRAPDAGPSCEFTRMRSQRPNSKAVLLPMRHAGGEVSLGCLGRANAAEITGDIGVEVQGDEVRQMILAELLGDQPFGGEPFHEAETSGYRLALSTGATAGAA
jgi:hypothetical protein